MNVTPDLQPLPQFFANVKENRSGMFTPSAVRSMAGNAVPVELVGALLLFFMSVLEIEDECRQQELLAGTGSNMDKHLFYFCWLWIWSIYFRFGDLGLLNFMLMCVPFDIVMACSFHQHVSSLYSDGMPVQNAFLSIGSLGQHQSERMLHASVGSVGSA